MAQRINIIMFVGISVLLAGCQGIPQKLQDQVQRTLQGENQTQEQGRPNWIDNPGDGVSASSAMHVDGMAAQEALAITRARNELAKRQGVVIDSTQSYERTTYADQSSSTSQQNIQESVARKEVRAKVKAKWMDPNGVLWVWVVPAEN